VIWKGGRGGTVPECVVEFVDMGAGFVAAFFASAVELERGLFVVGDGSCGREEGKDGVEGRREGREDLHGEDYCIEE
jgi:hypothetical protein